MASKFLTMSSHLKKVYAPPLDKKVFCLVFCCYSVTSFFGFSFDVAIKQAKNEDCESQDELLKKAEKLSKLRDNPNVVNIKGITLETAPDGLCR